MSDIPATDTPVTDDPKPADAPADLPQVDEWKPEPRSWSWKDIFTAPMLAFKPKCMLISLLTIAAIWGIDWLDGNYISGKIGHIVVLGVVVGWAMAIVKAVAFGVGATFVAIFMKADLLDDEFLSLKEGIQQFSKRLLPAALVPAFLVAVVAGLELAIYCGDLLCSIPWGGSVLYALLQVAAIPLGLFSVLLTIGVFLGFFVFPAIVAIRKHNWFDNVIDTFEAVGTKPHVLVASIALTLLMAGICYNIGMSALIALKDGSASRNLPSNEVQTVECATNHWLAKFTPVDEVAMMARFSGIPLADPTARPRAEVGGYYKYGTGLATGILQSLFVLLVSGYAINVLLAGGMLTYLNVREDDYWDDEDLEDLDALAKELEEEAKQAAAEAEAEAAKAETKPADEGAVRRMDPNLVQTVEDEASGTQQIDSPIAEAKPEAGETPKEG